MSKQQEAVLRDLEAAGATTDVIATARVSLGKKFPEKVYNLAVVYLGLATILLVLGAVVLLWLGKAAPDGLWVALGAGIGGLAGIFTSRSVA